MPPYLPKGLVVLGALVCVLALPSRAQRQEVFLAELPTLTADGKLTQSVLFELSKEQKGTLQLQAWQWRSTQDSLLLYSVTTQPVTLKHGAGSKAILFDDRLKDKKLDAGFGAVVEKFGVVPPGQYHLSLTFTNPDTVLRYDFRHSVDTTLKLGSSLRDRINAAMGAKEQLAQAADKAIANPGQRPIADSAALSRTSNKLKRQLNSVKGVTTRTINHNSVVYTELYYEDWLLGRYELADGKVLKERAGKEYQALKSRTSSLVNTNLEDARSIATQMRELYQKNRNRDLDGTIDLNFYGATGRDPYSALDPSYAEVYGQTGAEVLGIPVSLEGFYTTQDRHRSAKASYFRFHYDADKAKEQLLKLIDAYKNKYSEASFRGIGLQQVYGEYTSRLLSEKDQLAGSIAKDYSIDGKLLQSGNLDEAALLKSLSSQIDTTALIKKALAKAKDSAGADSAVTAIRQRYEKARQKLEQGREELQKRYAQYQELQQKAEKYQQLLSQYKTQLHLDSALNYGQLQQLSHPEEMSYKELATAASGLLPEGKVKKAVTGLTHFDAGILDQYESDFTLAGQQVKGLSSGYDIGLAKISATLGKTEYINREGGVDRYSSYLARADLKEIAGQKIGLVYYGYTPSRQILQSNQFIGDVAVAYPSFSRPGQVISLVHSGTVGKDLQLQSEAATSHKSGSRQKIGLETSAIKLHADYNLSSTGVTLKGSWEHMGRDFENQSLPYNGAGTDQYTAGISADLFHSFLYLAVQGHYLEQRSFSTTGYNTKWGFEVRTRSKRYPTLQLSYKPFSTFRALSDTLSLPQRPLFGDVWAGRATWQLKRTGGLSHRFSLSYNRNSSHSDTSSYEATTAQATYLYTSRPLLLNVAGGWMRQPSVVPDGYGTDGSWFVSATGSKSFEKISASLGQDVAVAAFGLQRLSTTASGAYTFEKQQLSLRLSLRYTRYRQDAVSPQASLYAGQIGASWRFKVPLSDPKPNF